MSIHSKQPESLSRRSSKLSRSCAGLHAYRLALACIVVGGASLLVACGGSGDPAATTDPVATPTTPATPSSPTPPTTGSSSLPSVSTATGDLSKAMSNYTSTISSVDFLLTDGKTAYALGSTASDTSYTRTVSTSADGINWSAPKVMAGPQDPSGDFAVNSKGVLAVHGCTYKAVDGFSVGVPYIRTSTDAVT